MDPAVVARDGSPDAGLGRDDIGKLQAPGFQAQVQVSPVRVQAVPEQRDKKENFARVDQGLYFLKGIDRQALEGVFGDVLLVHREADHVEEIIEFHQFVDVLGVRAGSYDDQFF